MADTVQVQVRLEPDCHGRLREYGKARHWPVATAARIIICEYLDAIEAKEQEERVT